MEWFLPWWSTEDFRSVLQGISISIAWSKCKALRLRGYGPPCCRRELQEPGCTIAATPWLHQARLKDSSTWRLLANCRIYLVHLKIIYFILCLGSPLRFFLCPSVHEYPLLFFISTKRHLSLLSGCLLYHLPAVSEDSNLAAPAIELQWASLVSTVLLQEGKGDLSGTVLFSDATFEPTFHYSECSRLHDHFVQNQCHRRHCFPKLVAVGLITICLCGSPAQCCTYQSC